MICIQEIAKKYFPGFSSKLVELHLKNSYPTNIQYSDIDFKEAANKLWRECSKIPIAEILQISHPSFENYIGYMQISIAEKEWGYDAIRD